VKGEDRDNKIKGDIMATGDWVLRPGEWLENGQYLRSRNGLFRALMNPDGNFMIRREKNYAAPENGVWESWHSDEYKSWAAKNKEQPGPNPGSNIAIMADGLFKVYQGVNYTEIKNHPERVSWRCEDERGFGELGIALEDDGRLRVRSSNGTPDASGQGCPCVSAMAAAGAFSRDGGPSPVLEMVR
jgi:hypothetical protein